jgi:hypothetical protein
MPKVIEKDAPKIEDPFLSKVREFLGLRSRVADLTARQDELKKELSDVVDTDGEPDEKGSLYIQLPEEIDGYTALKRQRKVSQSLDADTAEKLLKEKGLFDRCYIMEPVLKEDEVMACLYDGLLSEEEIDIMFPKRVSYAFVPVKS